MTAFRQKTLCIVTGIVLLLFSASELQASRPVRDAAADSIMQRVFTFAGRTNLRQRDFFADVYHQMLLSTERNNVFLKLVPGLSRVDGGKNDYFGESHFRLQVHPNGEVDAKEYAYAGTAKWMRSTRYRVINRYSLSIYNTKLFVDKILSPMHHRNRRFYRYRIVTSFTDSTGQHITRISVKPRFPNTQLVSGTIDVCTETGAVRTFDLSFYYALTHIRTQGIMGTEGRARQMPTELTFKARFHLLRNRVTADYHAVSTYLPPLEEDTIRSSRRHRFDKTNQYTLRIDTTQICNDRAYFDTLRPLPLPEIINQRFPTSSSVSQSQNSDTAKIVFHTGERKWYKRILTPATENLLFASHKYYFSDEQGEVKLPPLLTPEMFSYSRSKGIILQTKLRLDIRLSRDFQIRLRPKASYSFKQRQLYWRIPLSLSFWPRKEGRINFEVGNGNRIYSSKQAEEVRESLKNTVANYDSLTHVLRTYDFNFYKDFYGQMDLSFMPCAGLQISGGVRYHRRTLVGWGHLAESEGMEREIRSLAPRLHIDWTPCQYYYRMGKHKVPTRSSWPTFRLDYERGIKTKRTDSEYERIEFDVQYTKQLYALRSLYLRTGFGLFTNREGNYFLDYDYFRDENLLESWSDGMSGKFYSLNSRWYNESKYYVRLSATYESPMMLFSRIAFMSRVIQKERLYYNTVFVTALHPYTEFGYGISSHFADFSVFGGMGEHNSARMGVRLVFHWFDGW